MSVTDSHSRIMWELWRQHTPEAIAALLKSVPTPGNLALRSRYETFLDLAEYDLPQELFNITWELWQYQIRLLTEGDLALRRNDRTTAEYAFGELEASHKAGKHPLPLIDAKIGMADSMRQHQNLEESLDYYESALSLAREYKCKFAELRGSLGLGYVQLHATSAAGAAKSFERAISLARMRDSRIDLGNALVGLGECFNRQLKIIGAHRNLLEALTVFESLNSREGFANATVQLGEACRRARWDEDACGWYKQAIDETDPETAPIALANALDGLAEVEVHLGMFDDARRHGLQSAYVSTKADYPLGLAHALAGLALTNEQRGRTAHAIKMFEKARSHYNKLKLFTSEAAACNGLARCAEEIEEAELSVTARLSAVRCIERSRAAQVTHQDQEEYLRRFGSYYSQALVSAVKNGSNGVFLSVFEALAGRRLAGLLEWNADHDRVYYARLVAQLSRLSHESIWDRPVSDTDPEKQFALRMGRVALRDSLPSIASESFEDATGSAYLPFLYEKVEDLLASRNLTKAGSGLGFLVQTAIDIIKAAFIL